MTRVTRHRTTSAESSASHVAPGGRFREHRPAEEASYAFRRRCATYRAALADAGVTIGSGQGPVYAGPVLSECNRHVPPLSWFIVEPAPTCEPSLVATLESLMYASTGSTAQPRTRALMERVLTSDALHVRSRIQPLPDAWRGATGRPRIVLIDERSVSHADSCSNRRQRRVGFESMVQAAQTAHPDADFWLLPSADGGSGHWMSTLTKLPPGTQRLEVEHSLHEVLATSDAAYVVAASEGMGALLAGVPLHVFGAPYYAGWGLTHDRLALSPRRQCDSVDRLFETTFLKAASYLDPVTHGRGTLDAVLSFIELQHSVARRFSDLNAVAGVAFQWWKRPFATPYLTAGGGRLRWAKHASDVEAGEIAAIWGGRSAAGLRDGIRHVRIEDGFLHSTGLGSDMVAPYSQVIDRLGMYFDSSRPNELTAILNTAEFTESELQRAAALREAIATYGLTKYNLGRRKPDWVAPAGARVILVSGQVADDASIRLGTQGITTTEALLDEVRARRPDAFIVYKPHPDVLSGNRIGHLGTTAVANIVDATSDLISLIEVADEVHTLSSLSGFEALLRGKEVHTYGLPFYAGWGLTADAVPQRWRERTLTLDMLVAAVLLRYPVYWDWRLKRFTSAEAVVNRLAATANRPLARVRSRHIRFLVKAVRWTRNALDHLAWRLRLA
ncbi:capsular biosynthesis protein [Burkholderia sp. Ac-20345]|uniref:capsular polysaccharide export protein, LipB/KpsS family n=1 Tax=Burkholderia sp. Ac-20345 TaxID=2703891 RepID=UPI00197C1C58|nr:capsular biosynthesis protein [Burkholderia sp. Ac-20345]MBN3780228.1 capsular biosynthesis protein [Burkholderia sp. Ac-20345]